MEDGRWKMEENRFPPSREWKKLSLAPMVAAPCIADSGTIRPEKRETFCS